MKTPIFIHNPKAASTSIRRTLPRIVTAKIDSRSSHYHIHQVLDSAFIQNQIRRRGLNGWSFGVVRHPLDRLVSAFHFFKEPRGRTVRENYVMESIFEGLTLNEFVMAVNFEKISKYAPHFRRQSLYLVPQKQGSRKPDQILRFENLDADFTTLCLNLEMNTTPELQHRFKTKKRRAWEEELQGKALDKAMAYYRDDFTLFSYETPQT